MSRIVTAAVLLIGDEILSGRTQDLNLKAIAEFLGPLGVQVREARVVSDDRTAIVAGLNALRSAYDYVFTTGGIGPTHDDITADCVAAAFGVGIEVREDARALLEALYARQGTQLTPDRLRMARIPDGADLIVNPVTGAPGFQIGNVFVLAGVPGIMRGMLQDIAHRIKGGAVVRSVTVQARGLREGDIAAGLRQLQADAAGVSLGSYPFFRGPEDYGVALVARSVDEAALDAMVTALEDLIRSHGKAPERVDQA